jgi:hypothetical protein
MQERSRSTTRPCANAAVTVRPCVATSDSIRQLEMIVVLDRIRVQKQKERHRQLLLSLVSLWPIAIGLCLAGFAPRLYVRVSPYQPWALWILFPFVVLSRRPELHLGGEIARLLPIVLLYAQFPLDGLLARISARKQVTIFAVALQMFFMRFLYIAELVMVSGVLRTYVNWLAMKL